MWLCQWVWFGDMEHFPQTMALPCVVRLAPFTLCQNYACGIDFTNLIVEICFGFTFVCAHIFGCLLALIVIELSIPN